MRIKVCGMRNTQNIKELCTLPIHYIGFIFFEKSPRHAHGRLALEVVQDIPSTIKKTGVFVNETKETLLNIAKQYNLDAIQLHGNETPEYCKDIQSQGLTTIKAFGIDESFDFNNLSDYSDSCDFYLFDTKSPKHGGTGIKFDWGILRKYDNFKPIFLSGGITEEDVPTIQSLTWLNIHALDLNSKFEIEPALKNISSLQSFIQNLNDSAQRQSLT